MQDSNGFNSDQLSPDPIEALGQCRTEFKAQRKRLYSFLATVYALSLKILEDPRAVGKLFSEPYFEHARTWKVRSRRDMFREIFKYTLDAKEDEEKKRASKYGKLVWHLDQKKIKPEDAALVIETIGVEKLARHGIPDPVILDPRDYGDGMTGTGEKIDYGDEDDQEEDGWEDDDVPETHRADTRTDGLDEPDPTGPEEAKDNSDGTDGESESRDETVLLRLSGSPSELRKLTNPFFGREYKIDLTPVDFIGTDLLVRVRRVKQPKLGGWADIRPIIRDDEEYFSPDEWTYPPELSA